MRVIKKINNNVALCTDGKGRELVAFGTGIGFPPTPYELQDLSKVSRTFYGVEPRFFDLLGILPPEVMEVSACIVDMAKTQLHRGLNPNLVFSLADHINFAMERGQKGMTLHFPFSYDVEHLYPEETRLGMWAVRQIRGKLGVRLPKAEATSIALHFINAEETYQEEESDPADSMLEKMTE